VSSWRIQLPAKLRQFDYAALADVVVHVRYTAREGGDMLRGAVQAELQAGLLAAVELAEQNSGLARMVSLRHEAGGLARFFSAQGQGDGVSAAQTAVDLGPDKFPYALHGAQIVVTKVQLMVFVRDGVSGYTESTMQFWLQEPKPAGGGGASEGAAGGDGAALQLAPWMGGYRAAKEFKKSMPSLVVKGRMGDGSRMAMGAFEDVLLVVYFTAKWS